MGLSSYIACISEVFNKIALNELSISNIIKGFKLIFFSNLDSKMPISGGQSSSIPTGSLATTSNVSADNGSSASGSNVTTGNATRPHPNALVSLNPSNGPIITWADPENIGPRGYAPNGINQPYAKNLAKALEEHNEANKNLYFPNVDREARLFYNGFITHKFPNRGAGGY